MAPLTLQETVATALDAVGAYPQHDLLPIWRQRIDLQLGDPGDHIGCRRRGWPAILTARHVSLIWQQARPQDHRVEQLLSLAEHILRGTANIDTAWKQADEA